MKYNAFLSFYEADGNEVFPDVLTVTATTKEDARVKIKEHYEGNGYHVDLSEKSEEVIITDPADGRERVYYGFSEE